MTTSVKEWTPEALIARKWGVLGTIIMHHDSHGLCYDVLHDDGTEGCYDPDEFAVIPGEETCMESYFILTGTEDGISVDVLPKEEIEKRLVEEYYGSNPVILDRIPEMDKGYFVVPGSGDRTKILIIKGQVVTPRPVQVVKKFEL